MGIINTLQGLFNGSKNKEVEKEDLYSKSVLVTEVLNLVGKIKKINSMDNSIWNLSDSNSLKLERKSVKELSEIKENLENRYALLTKTNPRREMESEKLEAARWTGNKPEGWTNQQFDRSQREH